MAQPLNIRVVGIVSIGTKHKEIAATGTLAHPLESSIKVLSAPHQSEAAFGSRSYVREIPGAKIFVVRTVGEDRTLHEYLKQQPNRRQAGEDAESLHLEPRRNLVSFFYQIIFAPN